MADQPAKYLQENIGPVLSRALAEMAVAQPKDGVDFLSTWLKIYAEQEEVKNWREREEKLLKEEREKTEQKRQEKEAKIAKKLAETNALEALYTKLKGKVEEEATDFEDGIWSELIDVLQKWVSVQAVYLGSLDEENAEEQVIQYDYASTGSEGMKEKILKTGQGVTFGALKVYEEMPPDDEAKENFLWRPKEELEWTPPPEDAVDPPPKPCLKYYPVSVKCVTDVEKIHYFHMTRLGAYLAVPLIYSSYYTEGALEEAKKHFETVRAEEEAARLEKEKAAQEALEKGEEVPAEEEAPAEPVEEKPMVLTPTPIKKVCCFDTLGTNTFIDESKIPMILELFKAIGECKARTEIKHVRDQALVMIDEATRTAEWEEIEGVMKQAKEALEENEKTEEEAVAQAISEETEIEEKKELVRTKYLYEQAMKVALECKDKIMAMRSWVCVNQKVAGVVAAAVLMYSSGTKFFDKDVLIEPEKYNEFKESIYPKRKKNPDWAKLKLLLDASYFQGVEKVEIVGERKGLAPEQKLSFTKELVDSSGFDLETAKQVSPAFAVLFSMIQAACNYRSADVAYRTAKYKKEKAAGEEKGEPIGYTISETCDDCVEP